MDHERIDREPSLMSPPQTQPFPPSRYRRSGPRAKTGCGTCRKRRIKCDESKPDCQKCIRSGWKCDGYTPTPSSNAAALTISQYALPFRVAGSQRDRQLLHYFCVQGSADISGYIDSQFWSQVVLQISQHEPAVLSALVAMSSLHLEYAVSDGAAQNTSLAHYGKALRALSKRIEVGDDAAIRVALLCCILFYCFSATVGDVEGAMQHLDRGLHVVMANRRENRDAVDESICRMLERLDLQASLFDDTRMPSLLVGCVRDADRLETLEDAQCALDMVQRRIFRFLIANAQLKDEQLENIPDPVIQEKQLLIAQHEAWHDKFTQLIDKLKGGKNSKYGIQILQIHHRITNMLLDANFPPNPEPFECCPNSEAHSIIDLAEDILQYTKQRNSSLGVVQNLKYNVSLETGVVAPLSLLAVKCSDETVCKRAMDLLAGANRKEGLYDASTMAAVLQSLNEVKARKVMIDGGVSQDKALEYWAIDAIEGRSGELRTIERPVPKTVLHMD